MNKKLTPATVQWDYARNSIEIAWPIEQKGDLMWLWRHMVVTKILTKKKDQGQ